MIRYRSIQKRVLLEETGPYTAYGLLAEEYADDSWRAIAVVPDISCDKAFVAQLAEKCTRGQLSPIQMLDVVTDALS
ncbi:hypothetical protein SAMN05216343_11475 [Oscillibacter sp. PC13]|nr:hypothetical protein SAMN05216343_11475 [Oscillibacter sp. PC13]